MYTKVSKDPQNQLSMWLSQESASLLDDFFSLSHLPLPWTSQDIPPPTLTHDLRPNLDSSFFTICQKKKIGKSPSLAGSLWNYPNLPPTPPSPGIIQRSSLSVLAFFFFRDLPPQSHKSTEDRCLLCLIKALPPGVIPQFGQEEKPSEGGNVLDQSYEGPILYTLI